MTRASTSVIVVMFNSESTLAFCLNSIPSTIEVVLVDQGSSDASVSLAREIRPDAKLILAGSNRGFGAGCNLGAANAIGDVLVFLNPDAAFAFDSAAILSDAVVKRDCMVGPRIIDADGTEQTRARHWSGISSDIATIFLPHRLTVGVLRSDIPENEEIYRSGGQVPYIQGACMAIGTHNFRRIGGFDERFFLYHEEEVLARRLAAIEVPVILEPRAVITHIGGVSTRLRSSIPLDGSSLPAWSAHQYYRGTALLYQSQYPGPIAFAAVLLLWMVLLAMAALSPIRMLIGLRTDKTASWYRAAARGAINGWFRRMTLPPNIG